MTVWARVGTVAISLVAAMVAWRALDSMPPAARWIEVDAAPVAVVGVPYRVHIHLQTPGEGDQLRVDLRWTTWKRDPNRFLSTASPVTLRSGSVDHDVEVDVPHRDGLAYVQLIVYQGTTGEWSDRTRAAISENIPVEPSLPAGATANLRRLQMGVPSESRMNIAERSRPLRWLTAALFLAASVIVQAGRVNPDRDASRGPAILRARAVHGLVVCLGASGLWELLNVQQLSSDAVRSAARAVGLYFWREPTQHAVTALVFAVFVLLVILLSRFRIAEHGRVAWMAWMTHAALCLAGMLSLHAFDALAAIGPGNASIFQLLKLATAGAALGAVTAGRRRSRRSSSRPKSDHHHGAS